MYRTVISIKYDIQELLTKVDRLENQKTYFHEESTKQFDEPVMWNFPITTLDEVLLFEEKLNDKTFRLKMVNILLNSYYIYIFF